MADKELIIDSETLKYAGTAGHFKHCPFCGKEQAFLASYKCTGSKYQTEPIYQTTITCGNYRCNAQVFYNHVDLNQSRHGCLRIWNNRREKNE